MLSETLARKEVNMKKNDVSRIPMTGTKPCTKWMLV